MIQLILRSIIGLQLWHTELRWKGEQSDRCHEWRISSTNQVIEVARHSSSKGVHHEVHLFLYHLHLCNYVKWSRICDGWTTRVLSLWFAWDVATLKCLTKQNHDLEE